MNAATALADRGGRLFVCLLSPAPVTPPERYRHTVAAVPRTIDDLAERDHWHVAGDTATYRPPDASWHAVLRPAPPRPGVAYTQPWHVAVIVGGAAQAVLLAWSIDEAVEWVERRP